MYKFSDIHTYIHTGTAAQFYGKTAQRYQWRAALHQGAIITINKITFHYCRLRAVTMDLKFVVYWLPFLKIRRNSGYIKYVVNKIYVAQF